MIISYGKYQSVSRRIFNFVTIIPDNFNCQEFSFEVMFFLQNFVPEDSFISLNSESGF